MPSLNSHQSSTTVKAILMGDSGTGKTGALVSLVKAGYRLMIQDFDNGLDIVSNTARAQCPDKLDNVIFDTLTEKMKFINGKPTVDGVPKVWARAMGQLDKWVDGENNYGGITSWGPETIYVCDSLTIAAMAAFRHTLAVNGRLNARPYDSDYGEAQNALESWLQILYSKEVKCHVLVLAHIGLSEVKIDRGKTDDKGKPVLEVVDTKGLPIAIGKALAPKIPRYFNNMLLVKRRGSGSNIQRKILTIPDGLTEAKVGSLSLPKELSIETGLADFFKHVLRK